MSIRRYYSGWRFACDIATCVNEFGSRFAGENDARDDANQQGWDGKGWVCLCPEHARTEVEV